MGNCFNAYYADAAWVGFAPASGNLDIVLIWVKQFLLSILALNICSIHSGNLSPDTVTVLSSIDNSNFSNVGILTPTIPSNTVSALYDYHYTSPNPVKARYSSSIPQQPRSLVFVDEYQVLTNSATVLQKLQL